MVMVKYPVDSYQNPIFKVVAIPSEMFVLLYFGLFIYYFTCCQNVLCI